MFHLLANILLILACLSCIYVALFPRHTLYHWWHRHKLPHFTTAASLLEHLQAVGPYVGEFEYEELMLTFSYMLEDNGYPGATTEFTTTSKLRQTIIQNLEPGCEPWHKVRGIPSYQVDQLLPQARVEKLKLLVGS